MITDKKKRINTDKILPILIFILLFGFSISASAQENNKEDELFFIAQRALDDGFYDIAIDYFRRYIERYPQGKRRNESQLSLGQCYYNKGEYLKALVLFESLLKQPNTEDIDDAVLFWIAQVHLQGKDFLRARNFYDRLLTNFPKSKYSPFAYFYKAKSYFDQQDYSMAIEIWQRFIKDFPEHELKSEADFKIGEAMYRLKEYKSCLLHFAAFLKFYPKSSKIIEATLYRAESAFYLERYAEAVVDYLSVVNNTKNPEALWQGRLGLAWSYLRQKKYKEAEEAFSAIKKEQVTKEIFIQVQLGKAYLAREQKDYLGALGIYEEIIKLKPSSTYILDAYIAKAELLYEMNRFPDAITTYNETVEKFSKEPYFKDMQDKLHYNLAWSYLKLGDFKKSIEEFQKVAKVSSDKIVKISALCQVADTYLDNFKFDEAIEAYDSLLRDYPDSFYADYVQYQLANVLYKKKDFDAALLAFRSVLKNFSNSRLLDKASYAIILVYFSKGDFLAGIEQADTFIKGFPQHNLLKETLYIKGVCLYNLSRFKEAIDVFIKVQSNFNKDDELVINSEYQIADCFLRLGNEKEAILRFKNFILIHADSKLSFEVLLWLGGYFLKQDKLDNARYYLRQIFNNDRTSEFMAEAYYLFAQSFFQEENLSKALEWFDKAANSAKDNLLFKILLAKADTLDKLEREKEAIALYREIAQKSPELTKTAYLKMAEILRRQGELAQSLALLRKSQEIESEGLDAALQFQIAEVLEEMQDYSNAISEYLKVSYLYPQEKDLVVKSILRAAELSERKKDWQGCLLFYTKLIDMEVQEAKYAQERISWIEKNIIMVKE